MGSKKIKKTKANTPKRVLVMGDLHCGHESGLTPPAWQYNIHETPSTDLVKNRNNTAKFQKEVWDWYSSTVKSLGNIDVLFVMGDCIDGPEKKSGGSELLTSDLEEQAMIASDAINFVNANEIVMIYGTPYHTGDALDIENIIAKNVGAKKIGGHEWVDVNGLVFDLKHKVGGSSVPYGRQTGISRQKLWNDIWAYKQITPKSDVLLRGHNHYDGFIGASDWLAVNVPCMQWNTKYGVRQCDGYVSIGMVVFDVNSDGSYTWEFKMAKLEGQKVQALKL